MATTVMNAVRSWRLLKNRQDLPDDGNCGLQSWISFSWRRCMIKASWERYSSSVHLISKRWKNGRLFGKDSPMHYPTHCVGPVSRTHSWRSRICFRVSVRVPLVRILSRNTIRHSPSKLVTLNFRNSDLSAEITKVAIQYRPSISWELRTVLRFPKNHSSGRR